MPKPAPKKATPPVKDDTEARLAKAAGTTSQAALQGLPPGAPLPEKLIDIHNHPFGTMERFLELMDRNRVERALLMGVYNGDCTNEKCLDWMRQKPDRFCGGVFVDPRDPKAIETIRRYHGEGFRIVKLFPNVGYYPDDEAFLPFWETIANLKMGVLSHCGWLMPTPGMALAAYYSHPGRFEKPIRLFPETIFIFAHFGGIAGYLEAVMLTTRTPNAYVDCTPGQGLLVLQKGGPMASAVPPDRLMWGADGPPNIAPYVEALGGQGYTPHFEKIFYSNAQHVLRTIGAIPA